MSSCHVTPDGWNLFLGLFGRRVVSSGAPCVSHMTQLTSLPRHFGTPSLGQSAIAGQNKYKQRTSPHRSKQHHACQLPVFEVMTTIELPPSPLPPSPAPDEGWRPNYLDAYNTILDAERHAVQEVEADSSNQEAMDNIVFARVAGYFLLEFFKRRAILSEGPCVSLAKRVGSNPRGRDGTHAIVFGVGKSYYGRLLHTCAFGFFPTSSTSQLPCRSGIHQNALSKTLLAPFAPGPLLRHLG